MNAVDPDYPLSLFRDAAGTVIGRTVAFFLTCFLALGVFALIPTILGASILGLEDVVDFTVYLPVTWLGLSVGGIWQGWGLVSYLALAFVFLSIVWYECSLRRTLPLVFLIQGFEFLRCSAHEIMWEEVLSLQFIVPAALWTAAVAAYAVYIVRTRRAERAVSREDFLPLSAPSIVRDASVDVPPED